MRHLNESQRATVAVKVRGVVLRKRRGNGSAGGRGGFCLVQICTKQIGRRVAPPKAAEMLNVSRRLVEYAAKVLKEAEPELVKAARVSIRLDAKQGRFLGS